MKPICIQLADITSKLFINCNEKESRHAHEFGVSIVEFKCIRALMNNDQLTVNQMAKVLSLTSSRITRIVDGLVAKKLVNRQSSETDRRIYNLSLTENGTVLTEKMIIDYNNIHQEILSNIPDEYQKELIYNLNILNDAVEKWLEKEQ